VKDQRVWSARAGPERGLLTNGTVETRVRVNKLAAGKEVLVSLSAPRTADI